MRQLGLKSQWLQETRNNSHNPCNNNTEVASSQKVIDSFLASQNYHSAILFLANLDQTLHWVHCKRAFIEFSLMQKRRSLSSLRQALKFPSHNCFSCLKLLAQILIENSSLQSLASEMLQKAQECDQLPLETRRLLGCKVQVEEEFTLMDVEMNQLISCYRERGTKVDSIKMVAREADYRVVVANKLIKAKQIIIFVPQNQIITLEVAKNSEIVQKIQHLQKQFKSPKHSMMSLFLIKQKKQGSSSPYSSYISTLPHDLLSFPVYYGDALLEELEGTTFLQILKKKKESIQEDYLLISNILGNDAITYNDFLWARMIISSRIFGIQIDHQKTDALVPLADMINHHNPKMTMWHFCNQKRGFFVKNMNQTILPGQEIFDSYGFKCNTRFLLNYGFLPYHNVFNDIVIQTDNFPHSQKSTPSLKLTWIPENISLRNWISSCRVEAQGTHNFNIQTKETKFAKTIEIEIWTFFTQCLQKRFYIYPTTIEEDENLLKQVGLDINLRNCVEIRLGEQKLIQFYLKMGQTALKCIRGRRGRKGKDFSIYQPFLKHFPFI